MHSCTTSGLKTYPTSVELKTNGTRALTNDAEMKLGAASPILESDARILKRLWRSSSGKSSAMSSV